MRSDDRPALLVSVRSAAESRAAVAGGCDVLDIKEPSRGSLGAADRLTMQAICDSVADVPSPPPLSVALGELRDWADASESLALPQSVQYAKVGLSGCGADTRWVASWRNLRCRLEDASGRPLSWIAVAYVDPTADGPHPERLIDAAAATNCHGVLLDTFHKHSGRLFDHVDAGQLAAWRSQTKAAGLLLAVAGSLRAVDVPRLRDVRPDVIAVRGAACDGGNRLSTISSVAVTHLTATLRGTASQCE